MKNMTRRTEYFIKGHMFVLLLRGHVGFGELSACPGEALYELPPGPGVFRAHSTLHAHHEHDSIRALPPCCLVVRNRVMLSYVCMYIHAVSYPDRIGTGICQH